MEYETRVNEAKLKLEYFSSHSEELQVKLGKSFKKLVETVQLSEENNYHNACAWLGEQQYLSTALAAGQFQKSIGSYIQIIWQDTILLECMRISSIKKAMLAFIDLQSSLFNSEVSTVCMHLISVEEKKSENLKDTKLFKQEEFGVLGELGIYEDYIVKLANWMPENIGNFEWVLKEGPLYVENGVFQQWQECYGVIVKSRFLHIFEVKPNFPFDDPIDTVYLAQARLMVSQSSDYYVEITESTRKGILNRLVTGKQLVIKTKDPEALEEWMELIQSLK